MPEFTAGPWTVRTEDEWDEHEIAFTYIAGVLGADDTVIVNFDDDYGPNLSANAHLIAAAPDLYAALENVLEFAIMQTKGIHSEMCGCGNDDHDLQQEPLLTAEAALKKARGEQ